MKRNFLEREEFDSHLKECGAKDGSAYQDLNTIYGDMSRLVVAWIARMPTEDLHALYNELGWEGRANVRAMKEASKKWLESYHPNRFQVN